MDGFCSKCDICWENQASAPPGFGLEPAQLETPPLKETQQPGKGEHAHRDWTSETGAAVRGPNDDRF